MSTQEGGSRIPRRSSRCATASRSSGQPRGRQIAKGREHGPPLCSAPLRWPPAERAEGRAHRCPTDNIRAGTPGGIWFEWLGCLQGRGRHADNVPSPFHLRPYAGTRCCSLPVSHRRSPPPARRRRRVLPWPGPLCCGSGRAAGPGRAVRGAGHPQPSRRKRSFH